MHESILIIFGANITE